MQAEAEAKCYKRMACFTVGLLYEAKAKAGDFCARGLSSGTPSRTVWRIHTARHSPAGLAIRLAGGPAVPTPGPRAVSGGSRNRITRRSLPYQSSFPPSLPLARSLARFPEPTHRRHDKTASDRTPTGDVQLFLNSLASIHTVTVRNFDASWVSPRSCR